MSFDLIWTILAGTESFTWITVQQVDNQIFGISSHADRKLQGPSLDIIEKLSSKKGY